MKRTSMRARAGLVALVAAVLIAPLLATTAANAAGVLEGPALVRAAGGGSALNSGTSATTFTLRPPLGAACGGDSANDGYRVQSYMVPVSVDPSTLTFNASGPIPAAVGVNFRQPLFDPSGTPFVQAQTANAASPPGPGPVINIPDFNYGSVFAPGNIPAGVYNIGIACTLGPAGPTQMKEFWNVKKTFTTDPGGGPAQVSWAVGAASPSGCGPTALTSAAITWFPGNPGSQSGLKVACRFDARVGSSMVSPSYTIHDASVVLYHNGAARTVTNTAVIGSGATTFTASNFAATSAFVNRPITAIGVAGLPARTFVRSISGAGLVTLSNPTTASIPAGTSFKIDNTIGRSRTDVVTTGASYTLTSATANFTAADVGLSVDGTAIPPNTSIVSVTNATTVVLDNAATASATGQTVSFGSTLLNTTTRTVNDATRTSATVINSPAAKWRPDDIGLKVAGTGIPANTFIVSVAGANATTTGGLTVSGTPGNVTIGDPSVTAPVNGETAANQSVQLDLNPTLVAGSDDCANDTPEGFGLIAQWNNPGSFAGTGATNLQPAGTKAIGQLFFDTSAADFSAFVIEVPPLTPGDPIGVQHYNIVFPFVPTGLGLCASPTSPGLSFVLNVLPRTSSVAAAAPGIGKPGSAQLRSILPSATGGYNSTVFVVSNGPNPFTPAVGFNRLCVYPPGAATTNFQCGS